MTGPDDDFEEFLKRRKPVFERTRDELFEPPAEIDRVVLRQAREAIKSDEPMKVFSAPRWSVPLALAATLVLAFTVIFQAGMPPKNAPRPEVTVQNVSEDVGYPQVETASGSTAADIAPPAPPPARSAVVEAASRERTMAGTAMDSPAAASPAEAPAWRRDNKAWMAEIERLRKTGNTAAADAEYAEFKRQQRAYAVAPDR
ncbi:MAG TPA: hypothetical protein VFU13_10160 [Steroidobacteraceae bacterium]|nr:hypothetical protein [Steroidobacteraceae bacterium]